MLSFTVVFSWLSLLLGLLGALVPNVPTRYSGFCSRGWAVCRPTSCRCTCSKIFLIWLICCSRIGEAANPGPTGEPYFHLGSFNPSGLNHKAQYVSTHLKQCDVWAVSETHLSTKGLQSFRTSLKFHSSKFNFCIGGHPVSDSQPNGKWKGVAVLAAHPTRALPQSWPSEVSGSSRAMVAATLVHDSWVVGGVMYGEPDGHLHPAHRVHNEILLQHVAGHVCHLSRGFRYVAGDFNETFDSLPAFQILQSAGFKDLQTLALERFGKVIENTRKQKTRKDFCFISPELQDLLIRVDVLQDVFPDHAVLRGCFRSLGARRPVQHWFRPSAFPWPQQFPVEDDFWRSNSLPAQEKYAAFWRHVESRACEAVPFVVPRNSFGRGQTVQTKSTKGAINAPLRASRKNDFEPHFHGVSRRHVLWVRQVRRFQAYCRFCASTKSDLPPSQAAQMWRAIIVAKGFDQSFARWWHTCSYRTSGAPDACPEFPPPYEISNAMFETMVHATRSLEGQLMQASRQYAKLRRASNPNIIFRDVKEPAPGGPEVLARSLVATIEQIDAPDGFLMLDHAQDWTDRPILCNGEVLPVIHAEGDGIWVIATEGISVGMQVAQVVLSGTVESLSNEFLDAWKARWMRHIEVPEDRWCAVIEFAKQYLPRGRFSWDSLTVCTLQEVIKTKKPSSAGGPDGVSLSDLKVMPGSVLSNFCDMFADAESFGVWPPQVVAGKVSLLAKNSAPCSALDFRPITVLSLLYRCWSSFHARHALRHLDGLLPAGLAGSRPNKFAGQVWGGLLWDIERAYDDASDLGGVVADIQKAFNHLPRLAVMEICAHVGLPGSLLLGWTGALTQMTRRFQIHDHMTDPLMSCTGVPEGCALSCVAMIIIDWTLHAWFQHMMPLVRPLTYVDDWQIVTTNSIQIGEIMDNLIRISGMFDLLLDERKTYSWSITAAGRAQARGSGFTVVTKTRNLGAHVQFTRQHTNSVQVERLKSLQTLWPRLRISASHYRQKLRAILMAAWPKGLHAIAATTISSQWFQTLRAGAIKGLRVDGAGCNAHLHLGMVETPFHDPQFWSIVHTFWFVRDCGDVSVVEGMIASMVHGGSQVPDNSISSTLLMRIQTLGWHVLNSGEICDHLGSFSLFEISKQELELRASLAWQKVVAAEVVHRKGFADFHRVDPAHVRDWLRILSNSDRALFHKILNGSHFTQDVTSFSQPGASEECVYCGSSDSRFHRFWQCEFFQAQRADFPPSLWALIPTLPEVLTSYGWSLKPHTTHEWQLMLAQCTVPPAPVISHGECEILNLFTDGSCLFQHDRECRFFCCMECCSCSC